jgi:chromosome segregation ATPase
VLTGEHKREYMREYMRAYMRRRRAAENAGQPVSRAALEAEVERLRAAAVAAEPSASHKQAEAEQRIHELEATVERLTKLDKDARAEVQERGARLQYTQSRLAQKEAEVERLTKLHEDVRTEIQVLEALNEYNRETIKDLRDQLRRAEEQKDSAPPWERKGGSLPREGKGGSPLPPQVLKLIAHLGNENENERGEALKKVERALKAKSLNWSDVANRLR